MKKWKCGKCGRVTETLGTEVWCPPLTGHPKGWGRHLTPQLMELCKPCNKVKPEVDA